MKAQSLSRESVRFREELTLIDGTFCNRIVFRLQRFPPHFGLRSTCRGASGWAIHGPLADARPLRMPAAPLCLGLRPCKDKLASLAPALPGRPWGPPVARRLARGPLASQTRLALPPPDLPPLRNRHPWRRRGAGAAVHGGHRTRVPVAVWCAARATPSGRAPTVLHRCTGAPSRKGQAAWHKRATSPEDRGPLPFIPRGAPSAKPPGSPLDGSLLPLGVR